MERVVARRVIADKYRLDRALAAGGMGSVWAAWNTQLDVPVAVKFMAPQLVGSPELVARFEREARAAAQIRSSHVVQIFEHGIDGGMPFIIMELLEGEDLGARMRRQGRFSLAETAQVVAGVCKALRRAHAMGIVHRDLKPANVFLAQNGDEDDEETVKVLDFGVVKSLAEAVESEVTKTGELIGTPSYMSPEQARNTRRVDHRSDLWSLGIIAYRAVTATLPFPRDEGINRLMRICAEPIPPPSSVCSDLGPDVDGFFARALAIDPDDRFQTAREMSDAMKALAGAPLSSRSDSRRYSIGDGPPPSSTMYPAQAFVYTSASGTGPQDALAARRSSPRIARDSEASAQRGGARTGPTSLPAVEPRVRVSQPLPEIGDVPTRVSKVDRPGPARPPSLRPPVSIVTGALADAEGPLPPLSSGDLDTLSSAGLARSPSTAARLMVAPPSIAVGAGLAILVALGALGFMFVSARVSDGAGAPAATAATATFLFATAGVSVDAPAQGVPAVPAAAAPPSAEAAPSAPAATSSSRAATSSSRPVWKGSKHAAGGHHAPAPADRREGGIGRRPTY